MDDRLSDLLDQLEVRGAVSGCSAAHGRWMLHADLDADLKFIALVHGRATLRTDGVDEPVELGEGDVVVLNGRTWLRMDGGDGPGEPVVVERPLAGATIDETDLGPDAQVVIGGRIDVNPAGRDFLARALPPIAHVPSSASPGPRVRGHVENMLAEIVSGGAGSRFALRQYAQLLLVDVLRACAGDPDMPPGWLRAMSDAGLRPALEMIHEQPAKAWTLDDLARASAMSRTSFAQRFKAIAGAPPLGYLIQWRMLLARRALQSPETRIGPLAFRLGYASESAFSLAFKREVGVSPAQYRARASAATRRVPL